MFYQRKAEQFSEHRGSPRRRGRSTSRGSSTSSRDSSGDAARTYSCPQAGCGHSASRRSKLSTHIENVHKIGRDEARRLAGYEDDHD
jgi:hypothetical protein